MKERGGTQRGTTRKEFYARAAFVRKVQKEGKRRGMDKEAEFEGAKREEGGERRGVGGGGRGEGGGEGTEGRGGWRGEAKEFVEIFEKKRGWSNPFFLAGRIPNLITDKVGERTYFLSFWLNWRISNLITGLSGW